MSKGSFHFFNAIKRLTVGGKHCGRKAINETDKVFPLRISLSLVKSEHYVVFFTKV